MGENDSRAKDKRSELFPVSESALSDTQIVSVEANHDRWQNFLFPPKTKQSKIDFRASRVSSSLVFRGENNEVVIGNIEVHPNVGSMGYSSDSYDVWIALVDIWRKRGEPIDVIETSLREIATTLGKPLNGAQFKGIYDELIVLARTVVVWNDWHLWDNKTDNEKFKSLLRFRLNKESVENMLGNVTIPVNLGARRRIKSPLGRTFYSRIDNILASKNKPIENTARTIIDQYYLDPDKYRYLSKRKRLIETLVKSIDGKESSKRGTFFSAKILKTASGDDYKIRVSKSVHLIESKASINDEIEQAALIDEIIAVVQQGETNFHLYKKIAATYKRDHIQYALSELKEFLNTPSAKVDKSPAALFVSFLHRKAHDLGLEWIKPCDKNCKFRAENLLI